MRSLPFYFRCCHSGLLAMAIVMASLLPACGGGGDEAIPITISAQPITASSAAGGSVTFTVDATGRNLVYQWQRSTDQQATWTDITGATDASYVIALVDASLNGYWYRAVISGGGSNVTTKPVQLTVTEAKLQSRLSGAAYYDAALDVTIVADANLPASLPLGITGVGADGTMTWSTAKTWVLALNATRYLGYSDWRLPNVEPIDGSSFQFNNLPEDPSGYAGKIDLGYNISAPGTRYAERTATELPFLFYNTLGSVAKYSTAGIAQDSEANTNAPLINVVPNNYWTSRSYSTDGAMAFDMRNGSQYAYVAESWRFNVLVMRTGDVAP
jgi:hypothetical protein